jgi:RNA polymerase sigma factor (sigma-70 family)
MRQRDPQVLWRRFGEGDDSAFADLYAHHQSDVFRYCRSLLRHDDDARDAAHSAWAAVWTTADAARRDVPLRPWLFRIAHNEAIDVLRRRRPDQELDAGLDIPALDDLAADLELRERLATLRADLLSLCERQRSALVLRELGGLGHEQIGRTLGITTAAAKQTIYEARLALADAETGRSTACLQIRRTLSSHDRRTHRGRALRAHLRSCAACRALQRNVPIR